MTMWDLDKLVANFAKRLAAGEVMEDPKDLQFYANNSKTIEIALQRVQDLDKARAEYAKSHSGGPRSGMTRRIYGIRQWGTLTEQEAINVLCDVRRRFEGDK